MRLIIPILNRKLPKLKPWTRKEMIALLRQLGRAMRKRRADEGAESASPICEKTSERQAS